MTIDACINTMLYGVLVLFVWIGVPIILVELAFSWMSDRRTYVLPRVRLFLSLLAKAARAVIQMAEHLGTMAAETIPKKHARWRQPVRILVQVSVSATIIGGSLYLIGDESRHKGSACTGTDSSTAVR